MSSFKLPPFQVDMLIAADEAREHPQWWLTDEKIPDHWGRTRAGKGIRVGIVDTGIDETHLKNGEVNVVAAQDFTGSRRGAHDVQGHGTHVAGIINAQSNDIGVLGLAPQAELVIAKGLGDNGSGSSAGVARAIDFCREAGCRIINLSLGSGSPSQVIKAAVDRCQRDNVLLIAAAGNGGRSDNVGYPAKWPNVFAVGAVDRKKRLARFSDRGLEVQGVGFGVQVVSLYRNGQLAALSGTSMATPWIVGMIANRLSYEATDPSFDQTRTIEDLLGLYEDTADDLGTDGHDPEYGHGFPIADELFDDEADEIDEPQPEPAPPLVSKISVTTRDGSRYDFTNPSSVEFTF